MSRRLDLVAPGIPRLVGPARRALRAGLHRFGRPVELGVTVVAVLLLLAMIAPAVSPHDPVRGTGAPLLAPLQQGHVLGTDALSRDVAVRMAYGLRNSLAIAGLAVVVSMLGGVALGLVAALAGGFLESVVMRLVDVQLAFPYLVLALMVISAARPSVPIVIVMLVLAAWVLFTRTVRAAARAEITKDYALAAVALGASRTRLALRYILPNLMPVILALALLEFASLVIVEATLSYLGVGVPPPTPSLGRMMFEGQPFLRTAWWIAIFPGLALFVVALALNLASDGLRDRLDPRTRGLR